MNFFWPGVIGAVLMTAIGLPNWQPVALQDWPLLIIYAGISVFSHWLLLKCYEATEAARVQPYAYLQIVFVTLIGLTVYDETLAPLVAAGAAIVIAAGLYALSLERKPQVR